MEKKLSFEKKALSLQYQQSIDIFRAPRDISYYLSKNWIKGSVREKNTLIENLISLGILSEASTAEKLGVIFTGSDLKKLLKSYGQKTSGSKMELAKRLLSTDKEKYQEHVRDIKILKSSEHGKKLYRENEYLKESEFFHAQNEVISLLLANKIEDARRRYDQYWEIHDDIEWKELGDFRYQEIKNIMLAAPVSLEDLEANVIQRARVAVALEIFYPDEVDDNLITNYNLERFSVKLTDKIIINHIETNARIRLYLGKR